VSSAPRHFAFEQDRHIAPVVGIADAPLSLPAGCDSVVILFKAAPNHLVKAEHRDRSGF
jgi:hypothetical protein